jgi:hypothetical protein
MYMHHRRILCIDLGSSYTKVALRTDWDGRSNLVRDLPLASKDTTFCIPSVVVHDQRDGHDRWAFGVEAADQSSGEGVTVYRNWKARIFSDEPETQNGRDGAEPTGATDRSTYQEVGVRFFRGLKETLAQTPLGRDVDGNAVRVCIPKLEIAGGAERITEIMREAGWKVAARGATVYEPESNALGVLTRGHNATHLPRSPDFQPRLGRSLMLGHMLEDGGLLSAYSRISGSYGILVVDVGAFTTDFGYACFDTSFAKRDWKRPVVIQHSCELGVRELDFAVFQRLTPESQQAVRRLSSNQWDTLKAKLYAGGSAMVRHPELGRLVVGEGKEGNAIAQTIEEFAKRVIGARDAFCREHAVGPINAETLTGGGAMIPALRRIVVKAAPKGRLLYDLVDPSEPRRTLQQRDDTVDERAIDLRARENLELVRGGSALGGCSVFFE